MSSKREVEVSLAEVLASDPEFYDSTFMTALPLIGLAFALSVRFTILVVFKFAAQSPMSCVAAPDLLGCLSSVFHAAGVLVLWYACYLVTTTVSVSREVIVVRRAGRVVVRASLAGTRVRAVRDHQGVKYLEFLFLTSRVRAVVGVWLHRPTAALFAACERLHAARHLP
jgi:hypothetical protein